MKQIDISVNVCTYNRAEMLRGALESLICQKTDGKFSYEIVVIDDGSTDHTRDVVKDINENSITVPVRYFYKEGSGISDTRNRGVKESSGSWIAFFDDYQWAEPQWLFELYKVGIEQGVDCARGNVVLDLPDSFNGELGTFCRHLLGESITFKGEERNPDKSITATNTVIIHSKVFDRVGMFDGQIKYGGGDSDFFVRARNEGITLGFAPKAVVHHIIPEFRL